MTRHFLESLWNGNLEIPEAWTTPDKVNMAQWRFLSGHVIVKLLQYTKASWVRWHVPTIPVLGGQQQGDYNFGQGLGSTTKSHLKIN